MQRYVQLRSDGVPFGSELVARGAQDRLGPTVTTLAITARSAPGDRRRRRRRPGDLASDGRRDARRARHRGVRRPCSSCPRCICGSPPRVEPEPWGWTRSSICIEDETRRSPARLSAIETTRGGVMMHAWHAVVADRGLTVVCLSFAQRVADDRRRRKASRGGAATVEDIEGTDAQPRHVDRRRRRGLDIQTAAGSRAARRNGRRSPTRPSCTTPTATRGRS